MKTTRHRMEILLILLTAMLPAGCGMMPAQTQDNMAEISAALEASVRANEQIASAEPPAEVTTALLPPLESEFQDSLTGLEPRFDISVNDSSARAFFMSLVKDTPLNMVVHPDVSGRISITLQNVTIEEVLATTRDVYGYRYRRKGNTYQVYPARIRTQIFTVDYLHAARKGGSRTTVSSGRISGADNGSGNTNTANTGTSGNSDSGGSLVSGSVVTTESESDFWRDLKESLRMIIGDESGRKVMIHPQSGVIVVHALPEELRNVEEFLQTIENAAHRVVVLEAKVIEVMLDDKFQAGINWNALFEFGDDKSILFGHAGGGTVFDTGASSLAGTTVPLVRGNQVVGFDTTALGGIFTIDANLKDFNALIELLKTQGDVQVLSSPRISTVNNQKAVIKVGQDEFFVTDVETETDTVSTGVSNTSVDVTLTPFFSGVALDVIPQISDDDSVILHIHPAISEVTEKIKAISTSTTDELSIPLALSTIRESDTVIRAKSGQVVVLGGLMKNAVRDQESRTPFLGDVPVVGNMFRHNRNVASKSELVILLRPVVINNNRQWNGQLRSTADRFRDLHSINRPDAQPPTH